MHAAGGAPYVDFSIFGPYGDRIRKRLRFTAQRMQPDGSWAAEEVFGPGSYDKWEESWMVFKTGCVMLGFADPTTLDNYKDKVRLYNQQFPGQWDVLYQADHRARLEHAERTARRLDAENKLSKDTPWDSIFEALEADGAFWHENVEVPCLVNLLQGGSRYVTGEAPVATPRTAGHVVQPQAIGALGSHIPPQKALAGYQGAIVPYLPPGAGGDAPKGPRKRDRAGAQNPLDGVDPRQHNVDGNGRYTTNRKGDPLCEGWQTGACVTHNMSSRACAANPKAKHQCCLCLSIQHGADRCDKRKGGGKGKQGTGKGKNRQH